MENFQELKIFNNGSKRGTFFFARFIFLPVSFVITPLFIMLSLLIISFFFLTASSLLPPSGKASNDPTGVIFLTPSYT